MASSPPQASSNVAAPAGAPSEDTPPLPNALPPTIRRLRAVRALLWALVGVMTVVWLFFGGGLESITSMARPAPATVSTADIGQMAPPLRLPLVGGGETDLGGYRGQVVILNFWATWCEPCKAEMPLFERTQQQYRDRGLVVLGVNFQERDEEITAFLSQIGVTFPSLVDRTGEVSRQWRATGLPTTFLIDRQGLIRDVRVGAFTEAMLEDRLTKVLGE
jgi:cytochrome c biogenesis protein CcmG, thiol:disulfide interchange protein DsbE